MENIAVLFLGRITLVEAYRWWVIVRPQTKKGYYKQRLAGLQNKIFELDFVILTTRREREDYRTERDQRVTQLAAVKDKIIKDVIRGGLKEKDVISAFEVADPNTDKEKNKIQNIYKELVLKLKNKNVFKQNDLDEHKRLHDKHVLLNRDIRIAESNLRVLDERLNGVKPSANDPVGKPGLGNQMDDYISAKRLLKSHLKTL